MTSLSINGTRESGQDVRTQNVMAALAIANIVKSSLGPVGLDKMLVDDVGDVTITNDGATILKQLEVEHPAARVLVELSTLQDQEVGDGTTSVVILASELLRQANELVKNHVHPTSIIAGLNLAKKEACRFIAERMGVKVDTLGKDCILNVAKTALSSKIIGQDSDFFAKLAVKAVSAVKTTSHTGKVKYPVKNISILKAHGKSAHESELITGYALNCRRGSQGMPSIIKKAKIALLDFPLRKVKLSLGVQVVINDPSKLQDIRDREGDITKERFDLLVKSGVNVVFTTKGIDDFALKYFVSKEMLAVRRCSKADLKHVAKITGGQVLISFADFDGNESLDSKSFGEAELVEEARVGDGHLIYVKGCKNTKAQTIVLRGANDFMLDEIDRSLHDALCVVRRVLESKSVVPGGGCVEVALSMYMENIADTMGTREQLAIAAFSRALLIIPKVLAINGAFDAIDLVAKLKTYHNAAQTSKARAEYRWTGLDLINGVPRNNLKGGVLEPVMSKIKMIKFATEAAIQILRIDDSIIMTPKEDPKKPHDDHY